MSRAAAVLPALMPALAILALPAAARAGEAPCWFENGVVVVTAEVAGVVGDYILDTGAPQTVLAETQAQAFGYEATAISGQVALAGVRTGALPMVVKDIDVRTGLLPTPIAGIIGADALRPYVLDLRLAPCRLALNLPRRAPGFPRGTALPLTWIAGVPTAGGAASDGTHALSGAFALVTGSDTAVRLAEAHAAAPGADRPQELFPYGVLRPRLRALSFAGRLAERLPAGLVKTPDPEVVGEIGAPLLTGWRLRFDFPAGRLVLAP